MSIEMQRAKNSYCTLKEGKEQMWKNYTTRELDLYRATVN